MFDDQSAGAARTATKLRLTNQSRYDEKTANTAAQNAAHGVRPWEEA
jgi:hypothetical protein